MSLKRVFHYFRPGDLTRLEQTLDRMSAQGWQAQNPGRFVQTYRQEPGAWVHRFGYCGARPGSAGEITYLAAQKRAGWEPAARRKGWLLYRKPADQASEEETLAGHREPIRALFDRQIGRLAAFRRWMLVLAAPLLLVGYMADLLPLLYSTALPLAAALFITYQIKFMEEGIAK